VKIKYLSTKDDGKYVGIFSWLEKPRLLKMFYVERLNIMKNLEVGRHPRQYSVPLT